MYPVLTGGAAAGTWRSRAGWVGALASQYPLNGLTFLLRVQYLDEEDNGDCNSDAKLDLVMNSPARAQGPYSAIFTSLKDAARDMECSAG